ncbi:MAG TPA: hypothetical protein PLI45_02470 [Candidatus Woesebacteria bacterium]|nr:hypothetical protein [Candidatus Woesebacteria bacterium]
MTTLTETSVAARKIIKWGIIAFLGITVLWYLGTALVNYYKATHPTVTAPTMDFGVLPKIVFPESKNRPKMVLELPTGDIPTFVDTMYVYSEPIKKSSFSDAENAIGTAAALGFLFTPEIKTASSYIWSNQDQLSSRLEMNIVTKHFTLTRQWQNNPSLAVAASFGSDKSVITDAENYLNKVGLLASDIVGVEKIGYLKDEGGKLGTALSLSDADFVQLDLFRKNIDEIDPDSDSKEVKASYPFYRLDPNQGVVRMILSGSKNTSEKVIGMTYGYNAIDYTKSGIYPIKTGEKAWEELQNGGGYVYSGTSASGEIKVRRIFLGYFDASTPTGYAMPVYVFLGDQGFTAYISAVSDSMVK